VSPAAAGARSLTRFVEAVDADSFRVDRQLLYLALGDSSALAPALRGVSGHLTGDGFLLARVSVGSLPAALGLRSGDRLVAVNGRAIAGSEGLVAAYAELQRGARTTLTVSRRASTLQLDYTFE
jgi:S1-C subfamily serine protease